MTTTVDILEGKSNLSRLVAAVESGVEEEIVIARDGKPVARLLALQRAPRGQRIGLLAGKYAAPLDFDTDSGIVITMFRDNE